MRKFLSLFILLVLFSAIAVWLALHPGTIIVDFLDFQIEFSVISFLIGVVAFVFLLLLLYLPIDWLHAVKHSWRSHHRAEEEKTLNQMMIFIAEGEKLSADQAHQKAVRFFPTNRTGADLLTLLLSNTTPDGEKLYRQPVTKLLGLKFLIEEDLKQNNIQSAYNRSMEAFSTDKNKTWVLKDCFNTSFLTENYEQADKFLKLLLKKDIISDKTFQEKKALLFFKQGKLEKAYHTAPDVYALDYAMTLKDNKKIDKVLSYAWEIKPNIDLYDFYVDKHYDENPLSQLKSVERLFVKDETDKATLIVLAKASLKAHLWGEARQNLEKYLTLYPMNREIALEMARLIRESEQNEAEALKWEDKASESETPEKTEDNYLIE